MPLANDSDILIVNTPPMNTTMPPLGAAYLLEFLRKNGVNAEVFDLNISLYGKAADKSLWNIDALNYYEAFQVGQILLMDLDKEIDSFVEAILRTNTRIVGFSVNAISIFIAGEAARRVKLRDPGRVIIFGGPGCFWKFQRLVTDLKSVDIFVVGEGEEALLKIIRRLKEGMKIRMSPMVLTALPIKDLDSIPYPTFSGFDLAAYNPGSDYKPLPLLASRGCINKCSYCIDIYYWPGYRFRTPAHVLGEIKYHMDKNGVSNFELNDLLCNGNLNNLSSFCDLIVDAGLKINWVSYAAIRKDMDEELFLRLKRSGLHTLIYGVESGSDNVLRMMNKRYAVEDVEKVLMLTHQAGIRTNINLIAGFPGESRDDFQETVDFLERNRNYIDEVTNVSAFVLFPFSEVALNRREYGVIWNEGVAPLRFTDRNGLGLEERNERVDRLVSKIEEMGLRKRIVNQPAKSCCK